ncbi:hypothetical protein EW146_g2126 [Bondarzewia mesenterica]|uniref:Uncharacterized protein n=1 Tax=Bondarzewia mesenterica TaxID=1095465 RepID=A0A4S4M1T1_9AGAM|nr:hypothetical protein EW146_g2126 [Bondarzewia mesenterica]
MLDGHAGESSFFGDVGGGSGGEMSTAEVDADADVEEAETGGERTRDCFARRRELLVQFEVLDTLGQAQGDSELNLTLGSTTRNCVSPPNFHPPLSPPPPLPHHLPPSFSLTRSPSLVVPHSFSPPAVASSNGVAVFSLPPPSTADDHPSFLTPPTLVGRTPPGPHRHGHACLCERAPSFLIVFLTPPRPAPVFSVLLDGYSHSLFISAARDAIVSPANFKLNRTRSMRCG